MTLMKKKIKQLKEELSGDNEQIKEIILLVIKNISGMIKIIGKMIYLVYKLMKNMKIIILLHYL